jgi:hypothetical protein
LHFIRIHWGKPEFSKHGRRRDMETINRKTKMLVVYGQFSLALGILSFVLNLTLMDNNYYLHFLTGILLGLSLVMNLTYLIRLKK